MDASKMFETVARDGGIVLPKAPGSVLELAIGTATQLPMHGPGPDCSILMFFEATCDLRNPVFDALFIGYVFEMYSSLFADCRFEFIPLFQFMKRFNASKEFNRYKMLFTLILNGQP